MATNQEPSICRHYVTSFATPPEQITVKASHYEVVRRWQQKKSGEPLFWRGYRLVPQREPKRRTKIKIAPRFAAPVQAQMFDK